MYLRALFRGLREFYAGNNTNNAAAIAFYVLFSFFPMMILLFSIIGYIVPDRRLQSKITNEAIRFFPVVVDPDTNIVVVAISRIAESPGVSTGVGFLLAAWSGTRMFRAIRYAVNRAYQAPSRVSLIVRFSIDLIMILAVGLFFLVSIASSAFLQAAQHAVSLVPSLKDFVVINMIVGKTGVFWKGLYYALPLTLSIIAFYFLYWFLPATSRPRNAIWAGAITAGILFEAAKVGFVYYMSHFSRYDLMFGPLGAVVASLVWVYLGAIILLYGAEVVAAYTPSSKQRKK